MGCRGASRAMCGLRDAPAAHPNSRSSGRPAACPRRTRCGARRRVRRHDRRPRRRAGSRSPPAGDGGERPSATLCRAVSRCSRAPACVPGLAGQHGEQRVGDRIHGARLRRRAYSPLTCAVDDTRYASTAVQDRDSSVDSKSVMRTIRTSPSRSGKQQALLALLAIHGGRVVADRPGRRRAVGRRSSAPSSQRPAGARVEAAQRARRGRPRRHARRRLRP